MNKIALLALGVTGSLFVLAGCGGNDQPTTQKQPIVSAPVGEEPSGEECAEPEEQDPEGPTCLPIGETCTLGGTPCCAGSTCVVEPPTTPTLTITAKCRQFD
jgi:hypothetical protein